MEAEETGVVTYSPEAENDLVQNHGHTAHHWGLDQAYVYTELLMESARKAAKRELPWREVEDFDGLYSVIVKWKNATYNHNIVFKPVQGGIYVVRVLHGAMDIATHLG